MKKLIFAAVAMAVCSLTATANAGFVTGGNVTFSGADAAGVTLDGTLRYRVYQNTTGGAENYRNAIQLEANEYLYGYQFVNNLSGTDPIETFQFPARDVNDIGVISDRIIGPNANQIDITVGDTVDPNEFELVAGNVAFAGFEPQPVNQGQTSSILYATSFSGPGDGTAVFGLPAATATAAVPAAVPLPPAVALILTGIPCVGLLRRRFA